MPYGLKLTAFALTAHVILLALVYLIAPYGLLPVVVLTALAIFVTLRLGRRIFRRERL